MRTIRKILRQTKWPQPTKRIARIGPLYNHSPSWSQHLKRRNTISLYYKWGMISFLCTQFSHTDPRKGNILDFQFGFVNANCRPNMLKFSSQAFFSQAFFSLDRVALLGYYTTTTESTSPENGNLPVCNHFSVDYSKLYGWNDVNQV